MISNSTYAPVINALVEELGQQGLHGLSELLSRLFNELMKTEREQVLQAGPYERTEARKGYANGFKDKTVQTRFGKLELQVPQTREIAFYPQCLEKGERSERALKLAIAEMYVQEEDLQRQVHMLEIYCSAKGWVFSVTKDLGSGMNYNKQRRFLTLELPEAHLLKDKTPRNLRIISELGTYYAIFTIQKELPIRKPISKILALDPNHKNLAYGVDTSGTAIEIASPHWLKTYDKRLDELKSKRDRCDKKSKKFHVLDEKGNPTRKEFHLPSRQWRKYDHALKSALRKRREQTKTFMFTSAHRLFRNYDCIGIGDYTLEN